MEESKRSRKRKERSSVHDDDDDNNNNNKRPRRQQQQQLSAPDPAASTSRDRRLHREMQEIKTYDAQVGIFAELHPVHKDNILRWRAST